MDSKPRPIVATLPLHRRVDELVHGSFASADRSLEASGCHGLGTGSKASME